MEDRFTWGKTSNVPGVGVCVDGGALGLTVAQEDLMLNVAVVGRSWYAAGRNGPVRVAGCPHGLSERLT